MKTNANTSRNSQFIVDTAKIKQRIFTQISQDSKERRNQSRANSENETVADWKSDIFTAEVSLFQRILKRSLDLIIASIGLLAVSPVLFLLAVMVRLNSRGPVFYISERVGIGGKIFKCYKFRTMVVDAEEQKKKLEKLNELDGAAFKMKNDPRIAGFFSAFLRKSSLDELPQLINVIKGEMSLVGPRPPLPSEVEKYKKWYLRRLSVHPGITCTWQVSGRNNINFEDWMRLDLNYIDNWSLFTDIKLLFKTIGAVISTRGAC